MDNLKNIIHQKDFSEPEEIRIIKDFILNKFNSTVTVSLNNNQIIISAKNAALASSLRMELPKIQNICQTDKKINIRIGD